MFVPRVVVHELDVKATVLDEIRLSSAIEKLTKTFFCTICPFGYSGMGVVI